MYQPKYIIFSSKGCLILYERKYHIRYIKTDKNPYKHNIV